jgi:hypothetical protein
MSRVIRRRVGDWCCADGAIFRGRAGNIGADESKRLFSTLVERLGCKALPRDMFPQA